MANWSTTSPINNKTNPIQNQLINRANTSSGISSTSNSKNLLQQNVVENLSATAAGSNDSSIQSQIQIPSSSPPIILSGSDATLVPTLIKKEPYLKSWFTSSISSTTATANLLSQQNLATQPKPNNDTFEDSVNSDEQHLKESQEISLTTINQQQLPQSILIPPPSSGQCTNDLLIKTNNNSSITSSNKCSSLNDPTNMVQKKQQHNMQPQQPHKSSRRTTSLLNLFMSNSQGNLIIRESNDKTRLSGTNIC